MSAKGKSAADLRKERQSKNKGKAGGRKKKEVPEEELTEEEKEEKRQREREKFVLLYCTTLHFSDSEGNKWEHLFEAQRCEHYSDLQRLIAQITPKTLKIYLCQHMDGSIINADTFTNTNAYRVREMRNRKLESTAKSKYRPLVDPRWEFYEYHAGAPKGWVDRLEAEKEKKIALKEAEKERARQVAEAEKVLAKFGQERDSDSEDEFDKVSPPSQEAKEN